MRVEEQEEWIYDELDRATDSHFEESYTKQLNETSTFERISFEKLIDTNRYLGEQLAKLTLKHQELIVQSNERIAGLEREMVQLRRKLEEIQKARTLTVRIPKSWQIDEE